MRKLLALFVLLLSATAASAQTDKAQPVTKLPGEENLSLRERAERDFLMPVRRKKAERPQPAAVPAEQLSTAAPETDATAHYTEAAPAAESRIEVAAALTRREATAARLRAVRRAHLRNLERLAEIRAERRAAARYAARHHSSRKSAKLRAAAHSKAAKHSTKAKHHAAAKHSSKAAHQAKTKIKPKKTSPKHQHRR